MPSDELRYCRQCNGRQLFCEKCKEFHCDCLGNECRAKRKPARKRNRKPKLPGLRKALEEIRDMAAEGVQKTNNTKVCTQFFEIHQLAVKQLAAASEGGV